MTRPAGRSRKHLIMIAAVFIGPLLVALLTYSGNVKRVFLHGASAPDRVFLDQQHRGLITINDNGLGNFLLKGRPQGLPAGGFTWSIRWVIR